ncbi:MAG: APC family permease [Paenibacillaceae bacterium]
MNFLDFIGYDRHGKIKDLPTSLNKGKLNASGVTLAALGFNAPAWVAASSMSILYGIVGHAAPLAILIAYFFPMLIIALCMIYLVRQAPSAAGTFTFVQKFIHPNVATIIGWTYGIACAAVTPMTAVIGALYIQSLIPNLQAAWWAPVIGTVMILVFCLVSLRGIELTAKVAGIFLIFEIAVVAGLGIFGILDPHSPGISFSSFYSVNEAGGWAALGPGVLFGVWMLANFDSSINLIEEAKVPVRTIQKSMIFVLTIAFIVYSLAAIGWQLAVPVDQLASIVESGDGGPIGAVANVYLPTGLSWIVLFVVVTSASAGLQISMSSAARTFYRMSEEGNLPSWIGQVNKHKVPWVATVLVTITSIILVWYKPLGKLQWYYDVVTITLVISYISALVAFIVVIYKDKKAGIATAVSVIPLFCIIVLGYIGYTAGAQPADPANLYNAWYMGAFVILSGIAWVVYGQIRKKKTINVRGSKADL